LRSAERNLLLETSSTTGDCACTAEGCREIVLDRNAAHRSKNSLIVPPKERPQDSNPAATVYP
jgi:hypothetical protein